MSKYHTHSGPFLLRHRPLSRYCCYDALIDGVVQMYSGV